MQFPVLLSRKHEEETHFTREYSGKYIKIKITQCHPPVLTEAWNVLGAGNKGPALSRVQRGKTKVRDTVGGLRMTTRQDRAWK